MNSHLFAASWGRESGRLLKQLSVSIPGMRSSPDEVGVRCFVTSARIVDSAAARYFERDAGSLAALESFSNALEAAAVAAVSRSVLGMAGSSKSQNATWSLGTCAIHQSAPR